MTSPAVIVGEMTAWGLSEPCWGEARTQVSRLCSWAQDLSCLPWASRASPASAPSWCLFWVQTTRGGPRKWQLFLPGATWASGAGGPGGAPLSTRTCRFLCPAHLSPAALSAPEPAAHVPGGPTAACPVTDLKGAALITGEWRAASHLPLRSIGVCVCVLGVTLASGPWCTFPPRTSLGVLC